ncbi:MauE/DoxX family redox-associated membrane protein [Pedobacter sp. GSP4]|uniref:MauE/DoxX family redox-associated membrane protein n=1 Tax=Pedobacter sp. GSP4 TaxID=3453716 RepID=UPI003EE82507
MRTAPPSSLAQKLISGALIILWVYTALSKISEFKEFAAQLNNQVFDKKWTPFLIWFLPGIELFAAGLLLFNETKKYGLLLSTVLLSVFTVYIAMVVLHVFNRTPCSCGGVLKNLGWKNHLFFNLFFLLLSIIGIIGINPKRKEEMA